MSDTARADWTARIADRSDPDGRVALPDLPPPTRLLATSGVGQVTLDWDLVPGAVGYLVHRAPSPDGPFAVVDHHGMDVLAVPEPPYVDTTGTPGERAWYAVSAIPEVTRTGAVSEAVDGTPRRAGAAAPVVDVCVDAASDGRPMARPWEPMIGSERLSHLLVTDTTGGRPIGAELLAALTRMHDEIGVRAVRAHAVLSDDTGVYREVDGEPVHDFTRVDAIYDLVLGAGLVPVVEIGFMPRDLAADPSRTVFEYGAIISPPKDWGRWADLVEALVRHLLDRYGEQVLTWDLEVWNEANLDVFWAADQAAWLHLYDVTAAAVKRVDPRLAVGGPSSAAAGWVDDLLDHATRSGAPVDFVSTHTYGSPPLDLRAALDRHGFPDARILWTEWGVIPTHFAPVNDSVFAASFLLTGMRSAAGRVEALSYWVASDHFEELGRPPRLIHGGFGLRSVGDLPKPRYHALSLLARLGRTELPVGVAGDGAGSLVQAWAGRDGDRVAALVWTGTLDQTKADGAGRQATGASALDRRVQLAVDGLPDGPVEVVVTRLAPGEGDLAAAAAELGIGDWPEDDATWSALAERAEMPVDRSRADVVRGRLEVRLELPLPAAALVEVRPA